ncbi:MAG: carbohydrate-binding family V/XII [bacterium]|jgi:hypothetical protein
MIFTALVVSLAAVCAAQDGWPRQIEVEKGKVVIYQPQIESFSGDDLQARAAVSVTPAGQTTPVFGAVWMKARVSTDYDERIVKLVDLEVTNARFPDAEAAQIAELSSLLESEIPRWDLDISLDRLLAGLDAAEMEKTEAERINTAPPRVYFRTSPTVLVTIDGDPILRTMPESKLKYVANTAFFIVQDLNSKAYFLKGGDHWYTAKEVTGDWISTEKVPRDIVDLAQKSSTGEDEPDTSFVEGPPAILVSTEPAELILADGEPEYASVEGTQLLYMSNTESDVIMDIESQTYYVLLAGRWYISRDPAAGDWTYVAHDNLPEDFPDIPPESDMGDVLASVPGTEQARDAVLENQIPQTAEVDRKTATLKVQYDGDPEFEKCGDGGVAYARNADKSVLLIDQRYYCCDDAVWFESGKPDGPWEVSIEVPDEVQSIPPECPAYNVKYVYVYGSTPEIVYVGYTPGYTCSYVYGGVVVYGTGYWYRPWYRHYYYPRPVTYGFSAHYNPYTGWGFSFGLRIGWVGYGWHRPYYGGWWGPAGYRAGYRHGYGAGYHHGYWRGYHAGQASRPRPTTYQTANRNIYRNRVDGVRSTGVARPVQRPATGAVQRPATGAVQRPATGAVQRPATGAVQRPATGAVQRPATGAVQRPAKVPDINNNVFTDRNGNVYRQTDRGWEARDKGAWTPTDRASQAKRQSYQNNISDLSRQSQARSLGTQRTGNYNSYRQGTQRPTQQRPAAKPAQPSGGRSGGRTRR